MFLLLVLKRIVRVCELSLVESSLFQKWSIFLPLYIYSLPFTNFFKEIFCFRADRISYYKIRSCSNRKITYDQI